jgi:hypothetical protein
MMSSVEIYPSREGSLIERDVGAGSADLHEPFLAAIRA